MANYTIGQQPCNNYIPQMEANEYATWANVHDCYCGHSKGKRCEGTVSFCENCNSDHHSNGYESCQCGGKGKVHGTSQEERKEMSNEKPISHQTKWGYGTPKAGHRNDLGIYVRSSWEANYARYLNFLVKNGVIKSWDYEPDTFEFIGIKRGTRFYTPDFKVRNKDGQIEYHEVKGWMTPKSRTALDRMSRYYPDVKIVLIAKKEYELLQRKIKPLIPLWEGK